MAEVLSVPFDQDVHYIHSMKRTEVVLKTERGQASGELLMPETSRKVGIIIAHGAGGNMMDRFTSFFHEQFSAAGYPSLKFNFLYSQQRRKVPDLQPVLISCYTKAIETMPAKHVVIGGKSMGGRIASYVADRDKVLGLFFLGYPLHPPGKPDKLRDEHLYSIHKPMFFASGTKDPFARIDLLNKSITKIDSFASTYFVPEAGHSFDLPRKGGVSQDDTNKAVAIALLDWLETRFGR